jgi:hypothetical protein
VVLTVEVFGLDSFAVRFTVVGCKVRTRKDSSTGDGREIED